MFKHLSDDHKNNMVDVTCDDDMTNADDGALCELSQKKQKLFPEKPDDSDDTIDVEAIFEAVKTADPKCKKSFSVIFKGHTLEEFILIFLFLLKPEEIPSRVITNLSQYFGNWLMSQ